MSNSGQSELEARKARTAEHFCGPACEAAGHTGVVSTDGSRTAEEELSEVVKVLDEVAAPYRSAGLRLRPAGRLRALRSHLVIEANRLLNERDSIGAASEEWREAYEQMKAERDHAVKWATEEGERAGELAGKLLDAEAERDNYYQAYTEMIDLKLRAEAERDKLRADVDARHQQLDAAAERERQLRDELEALRRRVGKARTEEALAWQAERDKETERGGMMPQDVDRDATIYDVEAAVKELRTALGNIINRINDLEVLHYAGLQELKRVRAMEHETGEV